MAAVIVQQTTKKVGANLSGDIVLTSSPTVGNLLVLCGWGRGDWPSLPAGFTEPANGRTTGVPRVLTAYRVVQSGDGVTWATGAAGSRVYSLVEWSGIVAPDDVITTVLQAGEYSTAAGGVIANPAGDGHVIGAFGTETDVDGRQTAVSSPTTLIHQDWAESNLSGPYGSCGYGTGQVVATALNNQYQTIGYVAAHYPEIGGGGGGPSSGGIRSHIVGVVG